MKAEINRGIHIDAYQDETGRMVPCIVFAGQNIAVNVSGDELNEVIQFEEAK